MTIGACTVGIVVVMIRSSVIFLFLIVKVVLAAVAGTVVKCVNSGPNISLLYDYFILVGNLLAKCIKPLSW